MKVKKLVSCAAFLLLMTSVSAAAQETIVIQNATIVPVVGETVRDGSLLIQDGKIAQIGRSVDTPSGARVIDAKGKFVYPGMVSPFTAVGVTGYPGAGSDMNEQGPSTPQMDPYEALNPEDECVEVARIDGVTTVLTTAGSRNVFNGKAIVLNLDGNLPVEMVIKRDAAQVFNMSAKTEGKYPSTLPGVNALIRDKLNKAKAYEEKLEKKSDDDEPVKRDLEMEALLPVVNGEIPVILLASDAVTIRNALQMIEEYDLRGILHVSGHILKFADQLAAKNIPVIWAGTTTRPDRWEPTDLNYHTAAVLAEKGVLFAFTDGSGPGSRNVRRMPVPASLSVAHGLSEEEAVKAITINPAKILGVDDQVGSLEVGKMANVIICSKSLIQMSSKIETVIINGKVIPLTSYQTRLRDKFEKIVRARMAKKN